MTRSDRREGKKSKENGRTRSRTWDLTLIRGALYTNFRMILAFFVTIAPIQVPNRHKFCHNDGVADVLL